MPRRAQGTGRRLDCRGQSGDPVAESLRPDASETAARSLGKGACESVEKHTGQGSFRSCLEFGCASRQGRDLALGSAGASPPATSPCLSKPTHGPLVLLPRYARTLERLKQLGNRHHANVVRVGGGRSRSLRRIAVIPQLTSKVLTIQKSSNRSWRQPPGCREARAMSRGRQSVSGTCAVRLTICAMRSCLRRWLRCATRLAVVSQRIVVRR